MKLTKLLVMSALWLVGLSANAADLIERTKPTNEDVQQIPVEFKVGETYLLYNVTADKFFTQGNTWGTRGCVGPKASAVLVKVAQYKINDVWDEKTYEIEDYVTPRTGAYSWYKMCMDDAGSIYTDQTTWANRFYEIQPQGGNTYRLMPNEVNSVHKSDGTQFLGRDDAVAQDFGNAWANFTDDNERYPLSALVTAGEEGHHVDWQFFDAGIFAQYDKSEELKAAIEKAEKAGIDVSQWVAIYNNLSASVEEMEAAIAAIKEAQANNLENATGHQPQDASSWIVNATFDTVGNFDGWSGDKFGAGGNTSTNAEHFGKNYNTYQDVTVLYPGLYAIGVNGFYRAGDTGTAYTNFTKNNDESRYARLYATVGDQTEETPIASIYAGAPTIENKPENTTDMLQANGFWIPNMMTAANYCMHELGLYKNYVFMEIPADATLRIGVKKETTISNDWSIFDDFSLTFFGNGEDRFYGWAKMLSDAAPEITAPATQIYIDAYNEVKNNPTGNSKEEVLAYQDRLNTAKAELNENIRLWKVYEDSVAYALKFVQEYVDGGQTSVAVQILYNYVTNGTWNASAVSKIDAREMTNEELLAEIANLKKMIKDVIDGVELPEGSDVTNRLANPDFSTNDWTGWTHEAASGGNVRVAEKCCEAWNNSKFDIYQEVADMPVGVYEISVQGFYRYGRGNAWNDYRGGNAPKNSPTYIYLNANTTSFMNVFAEPTQITDESFYKDPDTDFTSYDSEEGTFYFPNGMSSSARAFDHDMYVNSAFGAVTVAGDLMRIGVKGSSNQLGDSWVIFDNFKLTFWGKQADKVENALEAALLEIEGLMSGRMGKEALAAIQTAYAEAQDALANHTSDGEYMFAKLAALYDAKNGINESVALMNELAEKVNDLREACIGLNADNLVANIRSWCNDVDDRLAAHDVNDSEVADLEAQAEEYQKVVAKFQELIDVKGELSDLLNSDEVRNGEVSAQWSLDGDILLSAVDEAIDQATVNADNVDAWIERMKFHISQMYAPEEWNGTDENPQFVNMIRSAKFSKMEAGVEVNSFDGWKGGEGYNFGNDDTQKAALALEYYHKAFDLYQELQGLPAGTFEVRANAFARKDASDSAPTFLYANTNLKAEEPVNNSVIVLDIYEGATATPPMDNVYNEETGYYEEKPLGSEWKKDEVPVTDEEGKSLYIPSDMVSSVAFFGLESKPYQNSVFVKVGEDGTLRLGIKTTDANTWAIMDDFQLIYYGANSAHEASGDADPTGIEKVLADNAAAEVLRTEYFTINGVRTMTPQKGIVIVRQTLSNGNVVVKKMNLK